MYDAHQEAFSEEPDFEKDPFDEWVHWSYREPFDPELWFVATDGDEIAGIALCRGERGGDFNVGWVNILGVRKPWRRRGLGKALLEHAFREFRARGKTHAGLGVDGRNEEALALYGRAGMEVERSSHVVREGPLMSRLRAKCPDCKTQTAVALGPGVRVPRLRAHVRGGHGARAARMGRRRRGDGSSRPGFRFPIPKPRSSRRSRSASSRSRSRTIFPPARSFSAATAARTSARSKA